MVKLVAPAKTIENGSLPVGCFALRILRGAFSPFRFYGNPTKTDLPPRSRVRALGRPCAPPGRPTRPLASTLGGFSNGPESVLLSSSFGLLLIIPQNEPHRNRARRALAA